MRPLYAKQPEFECARSCESSFKDRVTVTRVTSNSPRGAGHGVCRLPSAVTSFKIKLFVFCCQVLSSAKLIETSISELQFSVPVLSQYRDDTFCLTKRVGSPTVRYSTWVNYLLFWFDHIHKNRHSNSYITPETTTVGCSPDYCQMSPTPCSFQFTVLIELGCLSPYSFSRTTL